MVISTISIYYENAFCAESNANNFVLHIFMLFSYRLGQPRKQLAVASVESLGALCPLSFE